MSHAGLGHLKHNTDYPSQHGETRSQTTSLKRKLSHEVPKQLAPIPAQRTDHYTQHFEHIQTHRHITSLTKMKLGDASTCFFSFAKASATWLGSLLTIGANMPGQHMTLQGESVEDFFRIWITIYSAMQTHRPNLTSDLKHVFMT